MNCNEFNEKLFDYIDDELSDDEKNAMNEHLANCSSCRQKYQEYNSIISSLHDLPLEEPPRGYCKRLNIKLKASLADKKRKNRNMIIKIASAAAVCVLAVTAIYTTGVGRFGGFDSSKLEMMDAPSSDMTQNKAETSTGQSNGTNDFMSNNMGEVAVEEDSTNKLVAYRSNSMLKIIKSGSIYVETENFDKFYTELTKNIKDNNGYIENSNIYIRAGQNDRELKSGDMVVRVPQNIFDSTVEFIESNSRVTDKSVNEDDVTKDYLDKSNIVSNLELQEQKLRELLEKAKDVSEILQVENELRRIRTEIDSYNLELSNIDDRVGMATISLVISEVEKANLSISGGSGIIDKCRDGFINTINSVVVFLEELVVFIVSYSPLIIPILLVFFIVLKKIKKKNI